jgi:phage-related protein
MTGHNKDAISDWVIQTLDVRVDRELEGLSEDLQARFQRISSLLREHGPHLVREPYVKPLGGKLWEMRMKGRDNIARAIYIAAFGRRLVVLHVFVKKGQKTPRAALETAISRAKEAGLL